MFPQVPWMSMSPIVLLFYPLEWMIWMPRAVTRLHVPYAAVAPSLALGPRALDGGRHRGSAAGGSAEVAGGHRSEDLHHRLGAAGRKLRFWG